ncbi:MAG: sulfatase-like hydrolase/transferase [Planctomycetes bacterium]|nr:sulfatase-like hydrolase/transferase [Planctomycetota bacterium]
MALAPLLTLFAALSAEERKPDVLLVTLDTTRADRLGCYGHAAARTPFLDQLAAEGTRFTKAWCAAPITLPSHATLLTARPPVGHGARDNGLYRLDPAATTLAEVLAAHGFATGAFVGCFVLDARFGLAQGFAAYDAPAATALGSKAQVIERPAAAVVDAALAWLDTVPATQPFFLWLHFYEPHAPYAPPAAQRDLAEPYDGEIAACDAQLARFHAELAKRKRGAPLLEWVTADHGEALGEHGEATHGLLLHDATMRVPLLARGPGVPRGALREAPVSNGSIAPTLLAQLALDAALLPDADYPPLPLAAPAAGEVAPEPLPLLLETWLPLHSHGWTPLRGLVAGDKKLVSGSFDELFDLAADPREERDLAGRRPEEVARWRAQLEVEFVRATGGSDGTRTVDEAERAALAALGYVDASATVVDGSERPDPRVAIADEAAQQAAMAKYQQARRILGQDAMLQGVKPPPLDERKKQRAMKLLEEARATLAGLEERHPDDPSVAFDLGNVLLSMNRQAEAIPRFELAVVCDPKSPQRHFNLAVAYAGAGHAIAGIRQMEKAIHVEPRLITAYRWLVAAHEARNEIGRATWWADRLAAQKLVEGIEQVTLTRSRMQLYERMEKAGQRVQPPPNFPPKDLDPVGVDAR